MSDDDASIGGGGGWTSIGDGMSVRTGSYGDSRSSSQDGGGGQGGDGGRGGPSFGAANNIGRDPYNIGEWVGNMPGVLDGPGQPASTPVSAEGRIGMYADRLKEIYSQEDPAFKKAMKLAVGALGPMLGGPAGLPVTVMQIKSIIEMDKETKAKVIDSLMRETGISEEDAMKAWDSWKNDISAKAGDPSVSARSALGGNVNVPEDMSFGEYIQNYTKEVQQKNETIGNIANLVGGLSEDEKGLLDQITNAELKLFGDWWGQEKQHWEAAMGARGLITPESFSNPEEYKSSIFGDELGAFEKTGTTALTSLIGNAASREMDWTKFKDDLDYRYKALESGITESSADRALRQLLAQQEQSNLKDANIWSAVGSLGGAVLGSDWFGDLF